MQLKKILVIDDDPAIRSMMSILLKSNGYEVFVAPNAEQGFLALETNDPDLVVTDYKMPGKSGIDVILEISKRQSGLPVILMTAYDEVPLTVKAMQAGAFDYIEKSAPPERYLKIIKKGLELNEKHKTGNESVLIDQEPADNENYLPVGKTQEIKEIFKKVGQISLNRLNILITGEPGTEKDKIARLIHESGNTRDFPFFVINCKLLSGSSLEAELFGYYKDSDGGHKEQKNGVLELAQHGTVFLDGICYIPHDLQVKLIDTLKDRRFIQIGGNRLIPLNARIVAAIDENPKVLLENGKLLQELYTLLKVNTLDIPPLRFRKEDIPELLNNAVKLINRSQNTRISKIEEGVVELLQQYDWPENLKEFENVLMEAAILSRGRLLEIEHVSHALKDKRSASVIVEKKVSLADVEREQIHIALLNANHDLHKASQMLGISLDALHIKIKKYNLIIF